MEQLQSSDRSSAIGWVRTFGRLGKWRFRHSGGREARSIDDAVPKIVTDACRPNYGSRMARYDPLHAHLARCDSDEIELGFAEIQRIIGDALPASAKRPQWWANEANPTGHVQCRAWRNAGYEAFLLPRERVLFRRRDR